MWVVSLELAAVNANVQNVVQGRRVEPLVVRQHPGRCHQRDLSAARLAHDNPVLGRERLVRPRQAPDVGDQVGEVVPLKRRARAQRPGDRPAPARRQRAVRTDQLHLHLKVTQRALTVVGQYELTHHRYPVVDEGVVDGGLDQQLDPQLAVLVHERIEHGT